MDNHALAVKDHSGASVIKHRPLVDHPELEVTSTRLGEGWTREYKVDNFRTLKSGRIISGNEGWHWLDLILAVLALWLVYDQRLVLTSMKWSEQGWRFLDIVSWLGGTMSSAKPSHLASRPPWLCPASSIPGLASHSIVRICYGHDSVARCSLTESVVTLPHLGIQLSTTRQIKLPLFPYCRIPLSSSKMFIPLPEISTVVINEGLSRWSVRYYLAIIKRGGQGVEVAFDVGRLDFFCPFLQSSK